MTINEPFNQVSMRRRAVYIGLRVFVLALLAACGALLALNPDSSAGDKLGLASFIYPLLFVYSNLLAAKVEGGKIVLPQYSDLRGWELSFLWVPMYVASRFI